MGSILLVEADLEVAEDWSAAFAGAGHDTVRASTLRDAPPLVREGGIDVVVIDDVDHCIGVIELAKSIELLPDAPPIVLVSGSIVAPEISARIGAAAFVTKPCEPDELLAIIARLTGELRPVRSLEDEPTGPTYMG
ncbi:MAG TPA: response regulator [Kofleriaceae bacterium]|nr:response regulator [Kofleriaceae bacterium]